MSDSPIFTGKHEPINPIFEVHTESDLREAIAHAARLASATIRLHGALSLSAMVQCSAPDTSLTLLGGTASGAARIDCGRLQGASHGFQIWAKSITVERINFADFDADGSVLKLQPRESASVSYCGFRRCGVTPLLKKTPAEHSSEQKYSSCISCHSVPKWLAISSCLFDQCCHDSWQWSHCIYATADLLSVRRCVFRGGGNPLALYGSIDGCVTVTSCRFESPRACMDRLGADRLPSVMSLTRAGMVFAWNRVSGRWGSLFVGHVPPEDTRRHLFAVNEYDSAAVVNGFMADTSAGRYLTVTEWRNLGYDVI